MLPVVEASIKGYCFYRLVKPFMVPSVMPDGICSSEDIHASAVKRKRSVAYVGAAYFLTMLFLYLMPLHTDVLTAYGIGSLVMFCLICLADRRNYRQKAFLVVVFFSLSWLSAAMAEILYDNLYAFAENTDYMKNHPGMSLALYAGVCTCYLVLEFTFTAMGIWQVLRVYRNKSADMKNKELIMLALPALTGIMAYKIIQNYRMFYIIENGKSKDVYDTLIVLFYVISVIAIVVVIVLYQDIKARQEEDLQAELLAVQMGSIRRHMKQVESLYQNIRGIKHDMTNHILTLEKLYEGNQAEEAKAYSNGLKAELAQITGGIESGNPVTDVILQEFKKEAGKREISFRSEFYYPVDSNIDVFDISVILNNALQNAMENTEKEKERQISIVSYRRNNAYIIEICNSFTGNIWWNAESGLPVTSKGKTDGHGYGLTNIRRVAGKYAGDLDIVWKDAKFCLCVMLMIE